MKKVGVVLEVVTTGTAKRLAEIDLQLFEINKQMREARKLGQTDIYANLKQQQAGLRSEAQQLNKSLRDQQKTFDAQKFPEDSLLGLTDKYRRLRREIDALSESQRKSDFGRNLIAQASGVKGQIDSIGASVGDFRSNVGNYRNSVISALEQTGLVGGNIRALFGAGGVVAGVGLAIGVVAKGAKALFDINKEISAQQAAVQRTTGLTKEQVDQLTESLKDLDTATTLQGLLEISAIAGQLGIEGVDGVEAFTASVDNLVVALGDDFGGGAEQITEEVGRLSNVLFGATSDGEVFAQRLTNLGNALNVLAASGSSTAPVVSDFANRIAALALPLGVTQGEILGISATLQELGVSAERGGTATGRIFQALTQDADKFQEVLQVTPETLRNAGFQANSFAELVNTDLVGALQFAATRVTELSANNVDLAGNLKAVGLTGAGELEVFLKLGQANERLSENIGTATKALTEQDSILAEVAAKNESLAGVSQRLGNAFKELFVQAGIEDFFTGILSALIPVVNFFGEVLPRIFSSIGRILSPVIDAFKNLFTAIAPAKSDFSILKAVGDLLIGTLVFVADSITRVVNAIAGGIKWVREFVAENRFLSAAFEALKKTILLPFTLLSKLPALLNGIGAAFGQLKENITNLDFSKSIGQAFNEGYNRASQATADLTTDLQETEKQVDKTTGALIQSGAAATGLSKDLDKTGQSVERLAKGSIAFLNKKLGELKTNLEKAPNAGAFNQISEAIAKTEQQIAETEARFNRFRDAQRGVTAVTAALPTLATDPAAGIQQIIDQLGIEGEARIAKEKEIQKFIAEEKQKGLDATIEARKEAFDKELQQEEEFRKAQEEITQEVFESVGNITGQFITGQIATFDEFLKQIIITALDAAEKLIQLSIVTATAQQIATKGFVGIATGAVLAGLIKAGFAAVKAGIQGLDQGGEIRAYSGQRIGKSRRLNGRGRDSVLINAFPGEVVLNPEQQTRLRAVAGGGIFRAIGVPGFQDGGLIRNTPQIINPNTSIAQSGGATVATIDESIFNRQAAIIAAEVSRQVAAAVESGIYGANEKSDRRKALRNDRAA